MFETLSGRLSQVFDGLTRKGALSEDDVKVALREIRVSLLEADVALPVVRDFIANIQDQATGQAIIQSVKPGQQVVKIVYDSLVAVLSGQESDGLSSKSDALKIDTPPASILMVGLQGSGKTTTSAKLAKRLREKSSKRVLMASLDVSRPAAMEQLRVLGEQIDIDTLPIMAKQSPADIARRAKQQALLGGYDVYILDTAGRLHVDAALMDEIKVIHDIVTPRETLLVADGLSGQDAVNIAQEFDTKVGISGVIFTRMDGDGRSGAALSMRATTGKSIKFVGVGEKLDALEAFHPEQIARRILGMGDIVALVEKAQETLEAEKAERMMKRFQRGRFNMNDLRVQIIQMQKMGGVSGVMGMLPGINKMSSKIEKAGLNDRLLRRQIALIDSMTKRERANPQILQASRKKRIAKGAGLEVSEINKLLKMHRQMADMMKKMGKGGMLRQAVGTMFGKAVPNVDALTGEKINPQDIAKLDAMTPSMLSGFGHKK